MESISVAAPLALLVVSFGLLIWSGALVVRSLSRIAAFLQTSEFLVAFVFIGFATSIPNIAVSISAALRGDPVLAFTENVGSNIVYATLLIGFAVLLARHMHVDDNVFSRSNMLAAVIGLLPFALLFDGALGSLDAVMLITVSMVYFLVLLTRDGMFRRVYKNVFNHEAGNRQILYFLRDIALFSAGTAVLIASAHGVVVGSETVAKSFGVPLSLIGLFVIAIGVTLPEMAFTFRAVLSGHREMVLGGLFGTIVINTGFAIAPAALLTPIVLPINAAFWNMALFSVASIVLLYVLARSGRLLTRKEGALLIGLYALFFFSQAFLSL